MSQKSIRTWTLSACASGFRISLFGSIISPGCSSLLRRRQSGSGPDGFGLEHSSEPDEFFFYYHLGALKWLSEARVALINRDGDRQWAVEL